MLQVIDDTEPLDIVDTDENIINDGYTWELLDIESYLIWDIGE